MIIAGTVAKSSHLLLNRLLLKYFGSPRSILPRILERGGMLDAYFQPLDFATGIRGAIRQPEFAICPSPA
jgi:hypothetical protein